MRLPGTELYWDDSLTKPERLYCRIFGAPIIGLRIRIRTLNRHLPPVATCILDAGCGRGVISRVLAKRYPHAKVDAIDQDADQQAQNIKITESMGIQNCRFLVKDLAALDSQNAYDLIVSIDNLEHIENDRSVLRRYWSALRANGLLYVHVPHYYRRWPILKWTTNFDVPGHVRPGYHLPELVERLRSSGFNVVHVGFSYGFLENLANNISYCISSAQQESKLVYAAAFPFLNCLAWFGRWTSPKMGAGVWALATKEKLDSRKSMQSFQDELV
jgi:SAM-dependent methyltransferase